MSLFLAVGPLELTGFAQQNVHLTDCVASINLKQIEEVISALLLPGLLSFLAWLCRTVAGLCIGSLTPIVLPPRSLAFLTLRFNLPFMHLLLLFVLGTFDIGTDGGCITPLFRFLFSRVFFRSAFALSFASTPRSNESSASWPSRSFRS